MGLFSTIGDWLSDAGEWLYNNVPIVQNVTDFVSDIFEMPTGDLLTGGQYSANETNREIANQNVALTRETNAANLAFQKQENEITRSREDNAVRRAAADMAAAGLSKTLAAGSPASAAALSPATMVAPHIDYQAQKLDKIGGLINIINGLTNIKKQKAEIANIDANTAGINIDNGFKFENHEKEMSYKDALIDVSLADAYAKRAQGMLDSIKGESYGEYLRFEIDKLKASTKLTYEQIANTIAEREHLSYQNKKIIQDVLESEAKVKQYEHDLKIAKELGLPVGTLPGGLLGGAFSTGTALGNRLYGIFDKFFGSNVSFSNGGKAW